MPQTCGKRQLCRELGARPPAARERTPKRCAQWRAVLERALLLAVASAGAAAQPAPRDIVVSSTLERIAAADQAIAADELVVSVKVTNATEHVVDSIRITSPVPAGANYVPQSASGPGSEVLFSIDGGRTFGRPHELLLPSVDGGTLAADPALYTHVRWILRGPLDAGAFGLARFRAVPR